MNTIPAQDISPERFFQLVSGVVRAGERCWIEARGESMKPSIRDGDLVLLAEPPREARPGRVVLAAARDRYLLHRIVSVELDAVRTRGDSCVENDGPVAKSAVLARAIAVKRGGAVIPLEPTWQFGPRAALRYLAVEWRRRARVARHRLRAARSSIAS
jgi:hypothetical protein